VKRLLTQVSDNMLVWFWEDECQWYDSGGLGNCSRHQIQKNGNHTLQNHSYIAV